MAWADVLRLHEHWAIHPPMRALIAGFVGYKPPPEEDDQKEYMTADMFKQLVSQTQQGRALGVGNRHGH